MMLKNQRIILRPWEETDLDAMVKIYSDPLATRDFGRTRSLDEAQATLNRYRQCYEAHGFCRWALTDNIGNILGMAGIQRLDDHQCLGPHDEIGWRLLPEAWGQGYATEAAHLALSHYWSISHQEELLTYTAPENRASQAVMERLNFLRRTDLDFSAKYDSVGEWHGWVWSQTRL